MGGEGTPYLKGLGRQGNHDRGFQLRGHVVEIQRGVLIDKNEKCMGLIGNGPTP